MNGTLRIILSLVFSVAMVAGLSAKPRGFVRNSKGEPVAHASIMVYDGAGKMMAFAISDGKGYFAIDKEMDYAKKKLVVRCLGYQPQQTTASNADAPVNITLQTEDIGLKEVEVNAKPIRENKDTTQYLVSAFADGMEKNVEDLLKKLPGINVDEDGNISFKGKSIAKIMIDHTDMFGDKYKIASKTIPAKFIGSVEAIKHYQEDRHLKDVQSSDDVILNLTLKSDMKLEKPVGQIGLGGGYNNKYDTSGNLLMMNKKFKIYDAAAFSNIGESTLSSSEDIHHLDSIEVADDYFHSFENRDHIMYAEQKSEANSLNMVFQPNEKISVTNQLIAEKNRYQTDTHEIISYFNDLARVENNTYLKNKPIRLNDNLQLKYDINKSTTLTYRFKVMSNDKHVANDFISDSLSTYTTKTKSTYIENSINLSHSLENKAAIIVNYSTSHDKGNQTFDFDHPTENVIHQRFDIKKFSNRFSVKYYKRQSWLAWNIEAGYNDSNEKLNISTNDNGNPQFANYKEKLLFAKGYAEVNINKVKFEYSTLLGYWKQTVHSFSIGNKDLNRLKIEPKMSIEADLGHHTLSMSCSYEPGTMDPLDYLGRYTDYRTYTKSAPFYNDKTANFNIDADYMFSPTLNTSVWAMYMYSISRKAFVNAFNITQDMDYLVPTMTKDNHSHLGIAGLSHYIDAIRQRLKFSTSISSNSYMDELENDVLRKINSLNINATFSTRSVFSGPFNYLAGARYNLSSIRVAGSDAVNTHNYSFFEDLVGSFSKTLKVKLSLDEHFLGINHHFYLFAAPHVTYDLPKHHATIDLSSYNILNNRNISEYTVSEIYSSEYDNRIAPAYCLLSIIFRY